MTQCIHDRRPALLVEAKWRSSQITCTDVLVGQHNSEPTRATIYSDVWLDRFSLLRSLLPDSLSNRTLRVTQGRVTLRASEIATLRRRLQKAAAGTTTLLLSLHHTSSTSPAHPHSPTCPLTPFPQLALPFRSLVSYASPCSAVQWH